MGYRLNDSFFSLLRANLWPGSQDERAKESSPKINKYYFDGWFEQYRHAHYSGLRALPIEETVEDTRQILPFEDIVKVIDSFEYNTVSTCPTAVASSTDAARAVLDVAGQYKTKSILTSWAIT